MEFKHKSVLLEETVGNLKVKPDGIYVDGTLGGSSLYQICQQLYMPRELDRHRSR